MGPTARARLILLFSSTMLDCAAAGGRPQTPATSGGPHPPAPNGVVEVAVGGGTAFAVTRSHRLRTWALGTRVVQTLDREGVVRIARDGTVALASKRSENRSKGSGGGDDPSADPRSLRHRVLLRGRDDVPVRHDPDRPTLANDDLAADAGARVVAPAATAGR